MEVPFTACGSTEQEAAVNGSKAVESERHSVDVGQGFTDPRVNGANI